MVGGSSRGDDNIAEMNGVGQDIGRKDFADAAAEDTDKEAIAAFDNAHDIIAFQSPFFIPISILIEDGFVRMTDVGCQQTVGGTYEQDAR